MAMTCIHGGECDGCMACQEPQEYFCPICGEEVTETIYVSTEGDILGCENCVKVKEPSEVLGE